MDETRSIEYQDVIDGIDTELKRIHWSQERAINHIEFYYGVRSRIHLKDDELLEFWQFLKSVTTHEKFRIKLPRIKPLQIRRYREF